MQIYVLKFTRLNCGKTSVWIYFSSASKITENALALNDFLKSTGILKSDWNVGVISGPNIDTTASNDYCKKQACKNQSERGKKKKRNHGVVIADNCLIKYSLPLDSVYVHCCLFLSFSAPAQNHYCLFFSFYHKYTAVSFPAVCLSASFFMFNSH